MKRYYYHDWEMILYQHNLDTLKVRWGKDEIWNVPNSYIPSSAIYVHDLPSFVKYYKRLTNKRRKAYYKYPEGYSADSYEIQKNLLTECFNDVILHRTV